jgi:hypothetical protein
VSVSKLDRHEESPGWEFSARAQPAGRRRVAHGAVEGGVRSAGGVPALVAGSGVWLVTVTGGPGLAATGADPPVQPYPTANTPTASSAEPATAFQRAARAPRAVRGAVGSSIGIRF